MHALWQIGEQKSAADNLALYSAQLVSQAGRFLAKKVQYNVGRKVIRQVGERRMLERSSG